jgi:hypothetical protein
MGDGVDQVLGTAKRSNRMQQVSRLRNTAIGSSPRQRPISRAFSLRYQGFTGRICETI